MRRGILVDTGFAWYLCCGPIDFPAPLRHSSRSLRRSGPTVRSPARGAICHASIEQYKFCSHKKTTEFLKRTLSHAGSFQEAARPKNGRVFSLAPNERFQRAPGPRASVRRRPGPDAAPAAGRRRRTRPVPGSLPAVTPVPAFRARPAPPATEDPPRRKKPCFGPPASVETLADVESRFLGATLPLQ